jgi:hypothetical protein
MDEELVRHLITGLAQRLTFEDAARADLQQDAARDMGQMGGKFGVGHDGSSDTGGGFGRRHVAHAPLD